jgi:drug/metabolite transporter (DMT)-like permease
MSAPVSDGAPSVRAAWFYACFAVTLWAANFIPVKLAVREMHGLPTSLIRVTLAGLLLLVLHVARGKPLAALRAVLRAAGREFLVLGLLGTSLSFACFTLAIQFTSVSHAVFIPALMPLLVLGASCLQGRERLSLTKAAGFALAVSGIILLELDKTVVAGASGATASSWQGDLFAFGGVCCFAFFTVRGKRLAERYDSITVNTLAFGVGAAFSVPLLLLIALTGTPASLAPRWSEISWVAWTAILITGTVGSALPYYVYCRAMQRLKATEVATLSYAQPVIATLFGMLFLGERLGPQFLLAAALILAGVIVAERR